MNFIRFDVYVPSTHLEVVKESIFSTGACSYKGYERCCFVSAGTGQFRAINGANPFIGEIGIDEFVPECNL